ncbi:hypothetical protein SAMN05428969_1632 [Devosia sp. YR412]|uniref:hypothetical protein n=1 Tax=Devosia sp. YR412 TaxID=1881030 RepID=UPI0008C19334|nr:hypothetical protein [Devosia sp. YR412]SEQ03329.1 hypothetical protein SAMN05428969_1632 [Devosia sp. YR412]
MEVVVPILFQLITGAAGGNVVGQIAHGLNLGTLGNSLVGAVGGLAGVWLAGMLPGLVALVDVTPGAPGTVGSFDLGALAGQGAVGLVGGGVLTALVGLLKSALAKRRPLG